MSDKGNRNTTNHHTDNNDSSTSSRMIVGGRGTQNRPWIVDDTSGVTGSSAAIRSSISSRNNTSTPKNTATTTTNATTISRSRTATTEQQQLQQQQRNQYLFHQSLQPLHDTGTTTTTTDRNTNNNNNYATSSSSIRRATLAASQQQQRPYGQNKHITTTATTAMNNNNNNEQRRSSMSDIRSVASTDSGSSYDRYLAQKRATKEQRQQQSQLHSNSTNNTTGSNSKPAPVVTTTTTAPSSPTLEKHYTVSGRAVLLAAVASTASKQQQSASSSSSNDYQSQTQLNEAQQIIDAKRRSVSSRRPSDIPTSTRASTTTTTSTTARERLQQQLYPSRTSTDEDTGTAAAATVHRQQQKDTAGTSSSRDLRARRLLAAQQGRSAAAVVTTSNNLLFNNNSGNDIPTTISTKKQSSSSSSSSSSKGSNITTTTTTTTTNTNSTIPTHFHAHDAAVEKYLMRSRMTIGTDPTGRSRTNNTNNAVSSLSSASASTSIRNPDTTTTATTFASQQQQHVSNDVINEFYSTRLQRNTNETTSFTTPHTNTSTGTVGESDDRPVQQQQQQPTSHSSSGVGHRELLVNKGPIVPTTTTTTGWSTMKSASSTGYHNVTSDAIAKHDAYNKAETTARSIGIGGSTVPPLGRGSSKVDEYLAQRNALKAKVESMTRLKKSTEIAAAATTVTEPKPPSQPPIISVPSASVSFDESTDSERDNDEDESESAEVHDQTHGNLIDDYDDDEYKYNRDDATDPSKEWGVKVCIISAIDFPASVVPNLPFSPMLKLGLIKIEKQESPGLTEQHCKELAKVIERDGLSSIPNSRMRCTSSKILSKRDNGAVEFHEETRWDRVNDMQHTAIALELSSRAVLTPANNEESPPQQKVGPFLLSPTIPSNIVRSNTTQKAPSTKETTTSVIGSMFRNIRKNDSAEMEEANAAAAVAKHLVRGDTTESINNSTSSNTGTKSKVENHQSEIDVRLRRRKASKRVKFSEEFRIGSKVIPLSKLPLDVAVDRHETVRIEQWFELDTCTNTVKTSLVGTNPTPSTAIRNPSILLEISFSSRDVLDDSEDDMDESDGKLETKVSYSKRVSLKIRKQLKQEVKPKVEKAAEPLLEPGIIDFVCVVGARDIGDQKHDDGSNGWVNTNPECCILEQFPPDDEFHARRGRNAVLAGKVEWFCFPEGCKLWRGLTPPNHDELNLKRFSASTAGNISSSIASFDAALECTSSFAWFVIASSSDKYGSENKKTYGAVIRFFVPAPPGIDATQDDFAQTLIGNINPNSEDQKDVKRLWVPMGICMTSSLPIVGTMEVMLLRLCERLSNTNALNAAYSEESKAIREAIVCAIISFQKPIPGIVNCTIPFLQGDLLHLAVPARTGLPPLPHGRSVSAVCRLLGADGLNFLLAALLTECKILLHSCDVCNLSMVAEVLTSLMYPFEWALPYVPVLPSEMMEFVEAPISFLIGVSSSNMGLVDPCILEDVVVVDLDCDFATSDYFEGRWNGLKTKSPIPLPAAVASNIAKAAHRLIRIDDELQASETQSLPRLEPETLPEKEFRVAVALEVCSLIRGFDECLVFSSSQPVFNVDKFLQIAPSIFEEQRETNRDQYSHNQGGSGSRSVISSRSRRFVSSLVCCQHFHQFLDVLESDSLSFFHIAMRTLHASSTKKEKSLGGMLLALEANHSSSDLCKMLLKAEDKTPTYRVKSLSGQWGTIFDCPTINDLDSSRTYFPLNLLQQINIHGDTSQKESGSDGVKSVSVEYLVEIEKNPWRYRKLFNLNIDESNLPPIEKVKLREAIGDRRYKAWKAGYDKFDTDDGTVISDDTTGLPTNLDLRNLLATAAQNFVESECENKEIAEQNAKDRDTIRRCIEYPRRDSPESAALMHEAEVALRNPASKKFILEILSKRVRKDEKRKGESTPTRRRSLHYGGSKIDAALFDLLVRLSFAMLDSCDETHDFDSAYQLLKHSAGLYAAINETGNEVNVVYVTERIGLHPIYGSLLLWQKVKNAHSSARKSNTSIQTGDMDEDTDDEYEAVVATLYEMNGYGIPAKDLARFASKMCDHNGWFHSEKGQTILMLAKRVCVRRDTGISSSTPLAISDLALISPSPPKSSESKSSAVLPSRNINGKMSDPLTDREWVTVGWCHPAAQSSRRNDQNRRTAQSMQSGIGESHLNTSSSHKNEALMKRSAVTSMAYLGSSVVVTGGLDGGVFLARKVRCNTTGESTVENAFTVRGIHLDWGSSGSRYSAGSTTVTMDGEYGVGAVTCLAATQSTLGSATSKSNKDVADDGPLSDEELLESMEGCRVVAGTTCGDLRVWSIRDVFTAVFYANRTSTSAEPGSTSVVRSSGQSKGDPTTGTDFAAGSSLTRLKFSLRGRALSGHRGGVSCITVHSNIYRPDSIVSGGADGLIKLWSLRTPGTSGGRRSSVDPAAAAAARSSSSQIGGGAKAGTPGPSTGDALSILSGHGGRILCIKTAWHGDRLLSGGADRTVRVWDLAAGSGGKCLNTLSGHFGWVTNVDYWGQNTIVSTSTDRSISLWDVRVGNSPLFVLRHHYSVVSSLLVDPHCDAALISAAMDGSVASWDLRQLTYTSNVSNNGISKVVRNPSGVLHSHPTTHHLNGNSSRKQQTTSLGPIHLTKGVHPQRKTVQSLGGDAIIREWDYGTGEVINECVSGHCDGISNFVALSKDKVIGSQLLENAAVDTTDTTISASWDGTIRLRSLVPRNHS